ncbi:MAG: hypothetical protein ACKVXR_06310 [Planctomycetota bacterium]
MAFWAADRDGCAVYGLDEDLVLVRQIRLEWPMAVTGRPDGGAWILRATSGTSIGAAGLVRIDSSGAIRVETGFSACASLNSLPDGSAIVLEEGSGESAIDRVVRCDEAGRVEIVYSGRDLTCISASDDSIAVGDAHGTLVRVSLAPPGAVTARVDLHDRILDLESNSTVGHIWALTACERARIHRLDDDLVVRNSAGAGSSATSLALDQDPGRIWLVDGAGIRRLDEHGVVDLEKAGLPIVGPSRAVRDSRGGLLIASPGCVVRLDSAGRMGPGQGGFAHLVDVDRVP